MSLTQSLSRQEKKTYSFVLTLLLTLGVCAMAVALGFKTRVSKLTPEQWRCVQQPDHVWLIHLDEEKKVAVDGCVDTTGKR